MTIKQMKDHLYESDKFICYEIANQIWRNKEAMKTHYLPQATFENVFDHILDIGAYRAMDKFENFLN